MATTSVPGDNEQPKIVWRNSAAQTILLEDLKNGILTLDKKEVPPKKAWETYSAMKEFKLVPYDQFRTQLNSHRNQVAKLCSASKDHEAALEKYREKYPSKTHHADGRPLFYLSNAHKLLRQDIKDGKQKEMSIRDLRKSRPEYLAPWSKKEFKERVYQEVRYWKFCNWLEWKRAEKLTKKVKLRRQKPKKQGTKRKTKKNTANTSKNKKVKHN